MCGIAGIVSVKQKTPQDGHVDLSFPREAVQAITSRGFNACRSGNMPLADAYMGGAEIPDRFGQTVRGLKKDAPFFTVFSDRKFQDGLCALSRTLSDFIRVEADILTEKMGRLPAQDVEIMAARIESLRDTVWRMEREIDENIHKIRDLLYRTHAPEPVVTIFRRINAVLNSIDRLEVRGRDSAGVSLLFVMDTPEFARFRDTLDKANFMDQFRERSARDVLVNMGITVRESTGADGNGQVAVAFTYKVAAEIGRLGDNVAFLRAKIKNDTILQALVNFSLRDFSISTHTRWASVGAISEPNCHPVDNRIVEQPSATPFGNGIFHVCLNGDIDNYLALKEKYEHAGLSIHPDITTDTKIIPLQIEHYMRQGADVQEAFRLAVNDFEGSHAISMHTDLAPGKLFLAQKGSGQAIFVGLSEDHYMAASEVYGFIEETSEYLKMDGEKTVDGQNGPTQGQIFVLNSNPSVGIGGITALYYDGTPCLLTEENLKRTEITSRDIDRQGFPHYFLKEISEAPVSVERTIQNRWRVRDEESGLYMVSLDDRVVPEKVRNALRDGTIRRVFFVGQGTAGVAAQACADIFSYYMDDPGLMVDSLKASELSGFRLHDTEQGMRDTLVVAISQSGTTTDTNRTVDMVRERGACTLGIVNRRDSDLTFKVDGVMYTSSGRDIEMSVASTKAFYSQIVAGALLSLYMAQLRGRRDEHFVNNEVHQLLALPGHMRKILAMKELIENSARRVAVSRTYWAVVGSGPNKTSADEIRIKLSELCYKTISSDYVEDKKHIDLSSEPLIIVCAAGTRETVIGDIIKDTAIFRAHKAVPIVIADEGETRFDPYAVDVFRVPKISEHLAPVVNTLVGHVWGYYAALSINEGSRFLYTFREEVQNAVAAYVRNGLDIYEIVLEKAFREMMARFYTAFRKKQMSNSIPPSMGLNSSSDLMVLLKYLSGKLPVTDFEVDFGLKGTARNMLDTLLECLGVSINNMARPIDAIKHQAKTVTVGTSRISEKIEGILFEALETYGFRISQLTTSNVLVLKNVQKIVAAIQGATIYRIDKLNLLGEPTDESTIEVLRRTGTSMSIPSRVDRDNRLKGTKRIIVQAGNVYVGKGRKDDRSILCIPMLSASVAATNRIGHLVLLHISFRENVPLSEKVRALGGKYDKIKNFTQENSVPWRDTYLELMDISELFGRSAEKTAEYIVSRIK